MTADTHPPASSAPVDRGTAWKIVLSVVVVVVALGGLLWASAKEEIQLWKSPDEVVAAGDSLQGKRLNIGGHVLTLNKGKGDLKYEFEIESRPPKPRAVVKAYYRGVVPDTFKAGGEVVATGKLAPDGTFKAETIMAKCPSKYEAKGAPATAAYEKKQL